MSREYIRMRSTSDRELLLELLKEEYGYDEDAKTIDRAMQEALAFRETVDNVSKQIDELASLLDTEASSVEARLRVKGETPSRRRRR